MDDLIKYLFSISDNDYKSFNEKIVNGNSPIIGVRIPQLRLISKNIIKNNNVDQFLLEYKGVYFEEKIIKGLIISSNEDLFNNYVNNYLYELDSWCLVDTFSNSCKFINKNKEKYWELINSLLDIDNEFIIRTGYVFMLNYYLCDKFIDLVIECLKKDFDKYYINMAISWCISEAYIYYPDKIESLLKDKVLNKFVQNKSIDKINDSYRVSEKNKVMLRGLKSF